MGVVTGSIAAGAGIKALLTKLGLMGAKAGAAKAAGVGVTKMAASPGFKSALGKVLQKGFYPDAAQPVLQQVAGRVAPDVLFGGMAAMQTPGDLGDKLIAGGTQMIGGGLGGGLVTGVTGGRLGFMGELAGGIGGDYAGMFVGDSLMRGKDKVSGGVGQTPYERMNAEQQEQFAEQIRNETLRAAGIVPGVQSQYFGDLGLSV
jgi:hypothetical protein